MEAWVICVIFSVRGELFNILLKVIWLRDLIIWISGERCTLWGVKSFLNWTNELINSRSYMAQLGQLAHLERSIGEVESTTCQPSCTQHAKCWTGCQKGKSIVYKIWNHIKEKITLQACSGNYHHLYNGRRECNQSRSIEEIFWKSFLLTTVFHLDKHCRGSSNL